MRKILLTILLLMTIPVVSIAANMGPTSVPIGFYNAASGTQALNTSTTFVAFSFVPDTTKTINSVKIYATAVTGTLVAGDIEVHIYNTSTSDSKPNTSLSSSTTITALPTGEAVVEATGFSQSVTAGTQYWVVVKCPNSPTRYITMRKFTGSYNYYSGRNIGFGNNYALTADGSAWTITDGSIGSLQLGYSDSTYSSPLFTGPGYSDPVYGTGSSTRFAGFKMTTPANAKLKIRGLWFHLIKTGSPTGSLSATLNIGGTTYNSVSSIPPAMVVTNNYFTFYIPETIVAPSTDIRAYITNSAEDSSSNYYRLTMLNFEDVAASKNLIPWSMQYTYSTDNAASFTDYDEKSPVAGLLLAPDSQFDTIVGGGTGGAYVY